MPIHASPNGADPGQGTDPSAPVSLQHGLELLASSDESILYLHNGVYRAPKGFTAKGIVGTVDNRKLICSATGEHAIIDHSVDAFRTAPNGDWEPVDDHPGVYVSKDWFDPKGLGGSFLDGPEYTRLIVHQFLDDLEADNELGGMMCDDGTPDPGLAHTPTRALPPEVGLGNFPTRPFVYMGPGIHQVPPLTHDDPGPEKARIYIRLAPTHNQIAHFADYGGEDDPRNVPLAIWDNEYATLRVFKCDWLTIADLTLLHGNTTIGIEETTGLWLDHLAVYAGKSGVDVHSNCDQLSITNCRVDGGLPAWYFRSDKKDGVHLPTDKDDKTETAPGEKTMGTLLSGTGNAITNPTVHHCEFLNGHDLYTFGTSMRFFRNWIRNLNDDALVIDTVGSDDVWIYENVVEQCQMTISSGADAGKGTFVFRNLFDLRRPIAKTRKRIDSVSGCGQDGDGRALEHAAFFKSNKPDGPFYFFHNTCVIKDSQGNFSFNQFAGDWGGTPRQTINNIFIAIDTEADKMISMLPRLSDKEIAATDGNCFFRTGSRSGGHLLKGRPNGGEVFYDHLADFTQPTNPYFVQTGYEAHSVERDPQLRRFRPLLEVPSWYDDLRPRFTIIGGVWNKGIELMVPMKEPDEHSHPHLSTPTIGCFHWLDPALAVGVDGHRLFPKPSGATHGDPDLPTLPV